MAYPYIVSTAAWFESSNVDHQRGMFHWDGNRYLVLDDYSNHTLEVWMSTDEGVTWAEADSGNHKSYSSTLYRTHFHVIQDTSTLYFTYTSGSESVISPFDLATDTWGSTITGGPLPDLPTAADKVQPNGVAMSAPLGGGEFQTFYTKNFVDSLTDTRTEIRYQLYDGTSWGSDTAFLTPEAESGEVDSFSYDLEGVTVGATTRVHVNFATRDYGVGRKASRGGAEYGYTRNGMYVRSLFGAWGGPTLVTLGPTDFVISPMMLVEPFGGSPRYIPAAMMYEDADEPSYIRIDSMGETTTFSSNWIMSSVAADATDKAAHLVWVLYNGLSGGSENFKIRRACTKGGAWSAPSTIFDAGTDEVESVFAAIDGGQMGVGFSNDSGGTYFDPHYYQLAISCGATGCPAAGGRYRAFH